MVDALVRASFQRVSGPRKIFLEDNEAAAIVLGKDVSFYLPELVRHHRNLGVESFVYIDNGSTDGSVALAADLGMLTAQCSASFRDFQPQIRRLAATLYVKGGWRLVVDADELFDYPASDRVKLPVLLEKLNRRGHTAVVSQMLDMVPEDQLTDQLDVSYERAIELCDWYDTSDVEAIDYHDHEGIGFSYFLQKNSLSSEEIAFRFGGIRRRLFGEDCCLSKHALFRMGPGVDPSPHPHVATGLLCSDFTALIRHYKFTGGFLQRERDRVARNALSHGEAAQRMRAFDETPEISFQTPGRQRGATADRLLEDGFLFASDEARAMLA
ncbi:MAG: glycosyltransferase family 2 protein [Pseudomonadota bacterium]